MNNVEYYRRKAHMSQRALAEAAGISLPMVRILEQDFCPTTASRIYAMVAEACGVGLHELIHGEIDPSQLGDGDRAKVWGKNTQNEDPANCVEVFRREKNLTLQVLADRLDLASREMARLLCADEGLSKRKSKIRMEKLAEQEGMSPEEFSERYAVKSS